MSKVEILIQATDSTDSTDKPETTSTSQFLDTGPSSDGAIISPSHDANTSTTFLTPDPDLSPSRRPRPTNTPSPILIPLPHPTMSPLPAHIFPILACPLCQPDTLLVLPTTLHCGHSLCAAHLHSPSSTPLPPCPLSSCSPSTPSSVAPNIPVTSRVSYFPGAEADSAPPSTPGNSDPRIDVTLNKVIGLLGRAQKWLDDEQDAPNRLVEPFPQDEEDTDSEDEKVDTVAAFPHEESDDTHWTPAASTSAIALPRPSTSRPREASSSPTDRPRKRRCHHPPPTESEGRGGRESLDARGRFEKELTTELTCEICFMLLYQPVTTPCQHTFCAKCLHRALDHSVVCPLCRQDLPGFAYFQDHPLNKAVLAVLLKAFPETYTERGRVLEEEERDARLDTPIFVCQLSFPGMPTLLHFFEPRYRLMLRRCLESPTPCFGMIMPPRSVPTGAGAPGGGTIGCDYGTMLEIRSVQMLADGRSMVETWGTHRFRVVERGTLDGYMVGRIERIDDYEEELDNPEAPPQESSQPSTSASARAVDDSPASALPSRIASTLTPSSPRSPSRTFSTPSPPPSPRAPTTTELMSTCHAFLAQLRAGTAPWVVQRLNHTYGPMPTDPGGFSFWVALVLPIDEAEKAKLLPIKSARMRLRLVVHWIEQLNSNWWFSSGCVVL